PRPPSRHQPGLSDLVVDAAEPDDAAGPVRRVVRRDLDRLAVVDRVDERLTVDVDADMADTAGRVEEHEVARLRFIDARRLGPLPPGRAREVDPRLRVGPVRQARAIEADRRVRAA